MTKHFDVIISGKVQGVFFRASAQTQARELGIFGFARNEPDGSVYIEAEGSDHDLKRFVQWCHQGPPNARVDECDVRDGDVSGFPVFEIRR